MEEFLRDAVPVDCDIPDWERLSWYLAAHETCTHLKAKGFCFVRGGLGRKVHFGVEKQARALRKQRALVRTPLEALGSCFGESASAWTYKLRDPNEESMQSDKVFTQVESYLWNIGDEVAKTSIQYFRRSLVGRTHATLHHSKMPEDIAAPGLVDLEEADEYASECMRKKVSLLYIVGPCTTKVTITPREDEARVYSVIIKEPVVLIYRNESCSVTYESLGLTLAVQVDYPMLCAAGQQQGRRDFLPMHPELKNWYELRYQFVLDGGKPTSEMPYKMVRHAVMSFYKSQPVRIIQHSVDLPNLCMASNPYPLDAVWLGGQDIITQIRTQEGAEALQPWNGHKWSADLYYDPDPKNAVDFKMYTKHIGVLNRGHEWKDDYMPAEFNILPGEARDIDHRVSMLSEVTRNVLTTANLNEQHDTFEQDVGMFLGLSGQDHLWHYMNKEVQVSKYTWGSSNTSTIASRLSFLMRTRGPCLSIDTEESSAMVALDQGVESIRKNTSNPFAVVASASWISNPFEMIALCAAGALSASGRTRVFDESVDGWVKSEGVIAVVLEAHDSMRRTEKWKTGPMQPGEKQWEPVGIRALIMGSGTNSKGQSSKFSSPSAAAITDVIHRGCRDARIPTFVVDAIEVSASGSKISDTVELGCHFKDLNSFQDDASGAVQSVALRSTKNLFGNMGPVNGLAAIVKTCHLMAAAVHGPQLHLHQLMDLSGLPAEADAPDRGIIVTEAIEASTFAQLVPVTCLGCTGVSVHQVLWGERPEKLTKPIQAQPLSWWPSGPSKEPMPPLFGYYIVGTWSAWTRFTKMEREADGVYGYTLTMGDNNWEQFQVWLDEDADRVLHPVEEKASREGTISGPAANVGRDLSWHISGTAKTLRLINEAQHMMMQAESATSGRKDTGEHEITVVYKGDYCPPDTGPNIEDMPVIKQDIVKPGSPGDRYHIRLHIRGKYRRLEWQRLEDEDPFPTLELAYTHTYQIVGDHSFWCFSNMEPDPMEANCYVTEICLLKEQSGFQVYRDGDWAQGFYPAVPSGGADAAILGPDGKGHGLNFTIRGKAGDFFRVRFRRAVVDGKNDEKSITWEFVRHEEVDYEEVSRHHKFAVIGSWSAYEKVQEMQKDPETGVWSLEVIVGEESVMYFQILLNSNFLSAIYPSKTDATWHEPDSHTILGPDDAGAGLYWAMGLHAEDGIKRGMHLMINVELDKGKPVRVWWEPYESPDAHREYLLEGADRTLHRHFRMWGFWPMSKRRDADTPYVPAKVTGRPDFL